MGAQETGGNAHHTHTHSLLQLAVAFTIFASTPVTMKRIRDVTYAYGQTHELAPLTHTSVREYRSPPFPDKQMEAREVQ